MLTLLRAKTERQFTASRVMWDYVSNRHHHRIAPLLDFMTKCLYFAGFVGSGHSAFVHGALTMLRSVGRAAILAVGSLMHFASAGRAAASDEEPSDIVDQAEAAAKMARDEAKRWEFTPQGKSGKLTLESDPVLRWSNPHVGQVYGSVFVWTTEGQPQVVASIFQYFTPNDGFYYVELKSLSGDGLAGERDGEHLWAPKPAKVEFSPLDDAAAPRPTARERLQQMRKMASGFSAELTDRRESDDGKRNQLRLLPQPVYRSKGPTAHLLDGAMFSFVQGTDPEILLLFEAAAGPGGADSWRYAVARLNTDTLVVRRDSKEVWSAGEFVFREQREDSDYVLFKIVDGVPSRLPRGE
jgi:hypothetical protein